MLIKQWTGRLSTEDSNELLRVFALWHAGQIQTPAKRETLRDLINSDRFADLCHFGLNYADDYLGGAADVYHASQALAFYQKRVDLDIGVDRNAVAYEKFKESESLCAETNFIFRLRARNGFSFPKRVESVLSGASRKIASCLGDVPELSRLKVRFGPGATTEVKKLQASARAKLGKGIQCSEDLLPMLNQCLEEVPAWVDFLIPQESWKLEEELQWVNPADSTQVTASTHLAELSVQVVPGKLSFVPKNAKTNRSIVVEPCLNSMFQLGIGDWIDKRLRAKGVDIHDQERNQLLAKEGSLTGALATLDLSMASDTISRELVYDLLPLDWFLLLDHLRTGWVQYSPRGGKEELMQLEKFSSMGNGFTFPLETLLFWALTSACADICDPGSTVSIYGDDIICSVACVELLEQTLRSVGFKLNKDKSFSSGPFRESCGKDYFSGTDIRPFFQRDVVSGESLFALHNYYVRRGQPGLTSLIQHCLCSEILLFGPDGYGDGHLISDTPLAPHNRKLGWGGYLFETFVHKGRRSFADTKHDVLLPSYYVYDNPLVVGVPGIPDTIFSAMSRRGRQYLHGSTGGLPVYRNAHWSKTTFQCTYETPTSPLIYDQRGCSGTVTPGTAGYKRISIYTLKPA